MKQSFNLFKKQITEEVLKITEDTLEVILKEIIKNNGIIHSALGFRKKGEAVCVLIYLDSYFEDYNAGFSLKELAQDIYNSYQENRKNNRLFLSAIWSHDYETVPDKVIYKLINYHQNRELLEEIPHLRLCDLAIVFCLLVEQSGGCLSTAVIHNEHRERWGMDTQTLMELAKKNTKRLLPAQIRNLTEVMRGIAMDYAGSDEERAALEDMLSTPSDIPLYLLSNHINTNGAIAMMYEGILKDFATVLDHDLIILPSSIHEVLVVPYEEELCIEELKEMVRHINQTEVTKEEVLSDNVYLYSRKTDTISIPGSELEEER